MFFCYGVYLGGSSKRSKHCLSSKAINNYGHYNHYWNLDRIYRETLNFIFNSTFSFLRINISIFFVTLKTNVLRTYVWCMYVLFKYLHLLLLTMFVYLDLYSDSADRLCILDRRKYLHVCSSTRIRQQLRVYRCVCMYSNR